MMKKIKKCFWSYYHLWIYPWRDNCAAVSTCCNNTFFSENRILLQKGLKDVWNDPKFLFQRDCITKKDWRFCRGSNCCYEHNDHEKNFLHKKEVSGAIQDKTLCLDYFALKLTLIIDYLCNNNCPFCFQASHRNQNIHYQLSRTLIEEIKKDIIPQVQEVCFSGGEPLFSKRSREFIDWSLKYFPSKQYEIITNGILLDNFGLEKIVNNNIEISVSFYGMNKNLYQHVTGTDGFETMFKNINQLYAMGYRKMNLNFIVSIHSQTDIEQFCQFIENKIGVQASICNDFFSGQSFFKKMRFFEHKYAHLADRLRFRYRSETTFEKITRKTFIPFNTLNYLIWQKSKKAQ